MRQCEKCGEQVDQAKAFCPGCGSALIEESAREGESNFDKFDGTVQFGKTMYGQMLSDMGLDRSGAPGEVGKPIVINPAVPVQPGEPTPPKPVIREQVLTPATAPPVETKSEDSVAPAGESSTLKWILIAGGVLVFLGLFLILLAIAAYFFLLPRVL
jgi:hypothetical protein